MPTVNSVGAVAASALAITVDPGASHSTNDIDVLILETADQVISLSTPAGFAELTAISPRSVTGTRLTVFWRRWNGTDGSPTTSDSGNHQIGRMISVSGCKTTGDPWNITATGTDDTVADTSVSISGGTTTANDCLILAMVAQDLPDADTTTEFGSWANADLTNVTERIDNSTSNGNGGAIGLATGEKATAGAFGATTATSTTSAVRVCAMIALEGAAAATDNPYPYVGGGYYPTEG